MEFPGQAQNLCCHIAISAILKGDVKWNGHEQPGNYHGTQGHLTEGY